MLNRDHAASTPDALIEKRLSEGLEHIRLGRVYGPLKSVPALLQLTSSEEEIADETAHRK
jgi:hypothetical protein